MSDEDWVKAAMTDDSVVVELLFRLHRSTPPPPSKKGSHPSRPLEWSVRQRRSKPIPHQAAEKKRKKPAPTARDSPTTPLSWSGGATSVSGGCSASAAAADGFEESSVSPAKRTDAARSKVTATNETTTNKRAKKKKQTLAELKEEEILLVKERRHLKRELATLRATVEKQRATNESLKRLKTLLLQD
ncbi:uncharacterized protein LOC131312091 isoform X3 [Rhododendron vialii]|uniref:uncharacterized protein LOC131312091 isoform X3 n=1 Tax=Rhododendron vialii TaxID=182163 RepID=UPI00265E7CA9|nr:uncharacterized protein LOC131312091 isoform X3 [Rhododendron vialii]